MKRYREIVFSATVPEDRNVIWIFPVTKDIDNDLKDENLPVENFNEELYKVLIWGLDGWVNLFHGPLFYIKAQLLNLIGDIPEGKTVIQVIGELDNKVDLNIQEVQILNNALTVLEGIVSNKVDKVEGKELSDENFTSAYKNLLDTFAGGYMTFKDIVDTLPLSANNGDVYILEQVIEEETKFLGYIWSDVQSSFLPLGEVTNFSNFYTKDETYNKQEVESRIAYALNPITITQKYQPQGVGYWRGAELYPMLVDPMANTASNVTLGGTRGVINFYEMHNYFNIAFDKMQYLDTKLKIGGKNGTDKLTGIISLYNKTTQKYTSLIGGEGTSEKTYKLPSADTDGGETVLATIATATNEKAGLMSPRDKEILTNLVGGSIPVGGIIMWSGNSVPQGWALCDGTNGTPDLQGRFILGAGRYTDEGRNINYTIGKGLDGQVAVKLTSQQSGLPSHTHKYGKGYTTMRDVAGNKFRLLDVPAQSTDYDTSGPYFGNEYCPNGKDALQPHNNMPPYYVLAFIMRIA